MKNIHNKGKKGFKIRYFFAFFLFLIFLLFNNLPQFLKKNIEIVFLPIQGNLYQKKENIVDRIKLYFDQEKLKKENEKLKQENQKISLLLRENSILQEENKRLTSLLEMKQTAPQNIKFAKVYFRKPENMYEQFYIDLGKEDGIQKNMIVLQGESLVGRVVEVFEKEALVYMLTKENVVVSAKTENHMFGVIKGIGEEKIYFEPNIYDESLKVGDKVFTSGISDIYPGEVYIGYIAEIMQGDDSLFTSVVVKPSVNISSLKEVLLISPRRAHED